MARVLFLTEEEITKTTILGGNVDVNRYIPSIEDTQDINIHNLLGTELYVLMYNYVLNETTPTGDYLTLLEDYIKPITKFLSLATYLHLANYNVKAGGVFKNTGQDKEIVDKEEIEFLAGLYTSKAESYILRFKDWISLNSVNIPEYKTIQEGVDARDIKPSTNSYFI